MKKILLVLIVFCIFSIPLVSQTPFFKHATNTGNNQIIGIPADCPLTYSNGVPIAVGDEIGLFTDKKICAGSVVWEKIATTIIAWADNLQTPGVIEGFTYDGEPYTFRIYQKSTKTQFNAVAEFLQPPNVYRSGGMPSILKSLKATTKVGVDETIKPASYSLAQNYPNPFNPSTIIDFSLPIESNISLKIYDLNGKEIIRLIDNENRTAGNHRVGWDAKNQKGIKISSGIYFYRLEAKPIIKTSNINDFSRVMLMILTK